MTGQIHPLLRLALAGVEPPQRQVVLAADLQPGDELLGTAIGGYHGRVHSVQVGTRDVFVTFETPGARACLNAYEVCDVLRRRRS